LVLITFGKAYEVASQFIQKFFVAVIVQNLYKMLTLLTLMNLVNNTLKSLVQKR